MFATPTGFVLPARPAGSATIHTSTIVHGVTALLSGVRYGLFLCDTHGQSTAEHEMKQENELEKLKDLLWPAVTQFAFCEKAVPFLGRTTNAELASWVHEYLRFLQSGSIAAPSFGVELVWRTHLLQPQLYAQPKKRIAG